MVEPLRRPAYAPGSTAQRVLPPRRGHDGDTQRVDDSAAMIPQELVLGRREGMPRSSVANFDNLRTVPVSMLVERIGGLAAARIVEVKHALGHAVGWIELTTL